MFKPSEEKSAATKNLINEIFENQVGNSGDYTIVYAYTMKQGPFSTKMGSYVIGFSSNFGEMIVIPFDSEGNFGEKAALNKSNVKSAKKGLQGDYKITTNDKDKLAFYVVPYTTSALESAYVLPIIQEQQSADFAQFIKAAF